MVDCIRDLLGPIDLQYIVMDTHEYIISFHMLFQQDVNVSLRIV